MCLKICRTPSHLALSIPFLFFPKLFWLIKRIVTWSWWSIIKKLNFRTEVAKHPFCENQLWRLHLCETWRDLQGTVNLQQILTSWQEGGPFQVHDLLSLSSGHFLLFWHSQVCTEEETERERERLVTIHRCVAGTWRQWGCVPGPSGTSPALSTVKNVHTNHACGTCLLAIQCIPLGKSISCYSCLAACLECVFPYLCLWFPYLFSECLPFQGLSLLLNLIGFNHDVPTYLCMRSVFRSEIIHNI